MKKLIIATLVLFTINMSAQEHNSKRQKTRAAIAKDMSAEDIANLKSKKMTLQLDLTDQQQQQVYDLILANVQKRKALKEERQEGKDEKTKLTTDEKVALKNAKLDEQIQMKRALKNILTEEQYAKLEKMNQRRLKAKHKKKSHK